MGKMQRIRNVVTGILTIVMSLVMLLLPAEDAFLTAALILSFTLIVRGGWMLIYYFTMARNMVGGRSLLYIGIIITDLGIFTLSLTEIPHFYLMMYLFATHAFGGVIDILRSLEAKRLDSPSWKLNLSKGIVNTAVALLSVVFLRRIGVLVYLYCAGLIYSAVVRIISAFRKTEIVYVQ